MLSLRGLNSKRVVSLDWDDQALRMVWGRAQKGRLQDVRSASAAFPEDLDRTDAAALGAFVRTCLAEHKISAHQAVVDIPRDQAILNTLSLPRAPDAELPRVAENSFSTMPVSPASTLSSSGTWP